MFFKSQESEHLGDFLNEPSDLPQNLDHFEFPQVDEGDFMDPFQVKEVPIPAPNWENPELEKGLARTEVESRISKVSKTSKVSKLSKVVKLSKEWEKDQTPAKPRRGRKRTLTQRERLARSKERSKRTRERKKNYIQALETKIQNLEAENMDLEKENQRLRNLLSQPKANLSLDQVSQEYFHGHPQEVSEIMKDFDQGMESERDNKKFSQLLERMESECIAKLNDSIQNLSQILFPFGQPKYFKFLENGYNCDFELIEKIQRVSKYKVEELKKVHNLTEIDDYIISLAPSGTQFCLLVEKISIETHLSTLFSSLQNLKSEIQDAIHKYLEISSKLYNSGVEIPNGSGVQNLGFDLSPSQNNFGDLGNFLESRNY